MLALANSALGFGTLLVLVAILAYGMLVAGRHANRLAERLGARRSLWGALALSLAAVAISIYYSDFAGYVPCTLCWYQRIAMYPLPLLIAIALYRRDERHVLPYAMALAWAGLAIGLLHVNVQAGNGAAIAGFCGVGAGEGCDVPPFVTWGFVTIPVASAATFALLLAAFDLARRSLRHEHPHAAR